MAKFKGTIMLLLTAFIWGLAFVAQSSAADYIGSFTFNAARSFVAVPFLLLVIAIRSVKNTKTPKKPIFDKKTIIAGSICGTVLFFASNFQQFGVAAYPEGAAASGRAGFLTATYVVMVAAFSAITSKKIKPLILFSSLICLCGMYMLCISEGISNIYFGDYLVLICALMFTLHILVIDKFHDIDGIKMSCIQFLVCGILSLICSLVFEEINCENLLNAWTLILYAGVCSSGIGYTLQIVGQKYTPPTIASIIMSLESVFAALTGWIILGEQLSARELMGCILVFGAVIISQIPEENLQWKKS